jgi:hypothetical protein
MRWLGTIAHEPPDRPKKNELLHNWCACMATELFSIIEQLVTCNSTFACCNDDAFKCRYSQKHGLLLECSDLAITRLKGFPRHKAKLDPSNFAIKATRQASCQISFLYWAIWSAWCKAQPLPMDRAALVCTFMLHNQAIVCSDLQTSLLMSVAESRFSLSC